MGYTGREPGTYRQRARTLLFNLRDSNNPQLRGRVLTRDLTAAALAQMSSEDLASKVKNGSATADLQTEAAYRPGHRPDRIEVLKC